MDFHFGPFGEYIIYTIYFWYVTMPLACLLLWGCLRRKTPRGVRWISGIGAAVLLFPVVVMMWVLVSGSIEDGKSRREFRQQKALHTFILKQPETVAGIALSTNDTVYYQTDFDMNHRKEAELMDVDSVHLTKPTYFFNLQVKDYIGVVINDYDTWNVTLTHDQLVFGWPCTGKVVITTDSTFVSGTLSKDHVAWGHHLPKGAEVIYKKEYEQLNIILPDSEFITIDLKTK